MASNRPNAVNPCNVTGQGCNLDGTRGRPGNENILVANIRRIRQTVAEGRNGINNDDEAPSMRLLCAGCKNPTHYYEANTLASVLFFALFRPLGPPRRD